MGTVFMQINGVLVVWALIFILANVAETLKRYINHIIGKK